MSANPCRVLLGHNFCLKYISTIIVLSTLWFVWYTASYFLSMCNQLKMTPIRAVLPLFSCILMHKYRRKYNQSHYKLFITARNALCTERKMQETIDYLCHCEYQVSIHLCLTYSAFWRINIHSRYVSAVNGCYCFHYKTQSEETADLIILL